MKLVITDKHLCYKIWIKTNIYLSIIIYIIYLYIVSKVGDISQGQLEGSLFLSYYTEM